MKLGTKIIGAALLAITLAVAVALLVQKFVIHRQGVQLTVETMRAAVIEAENVRESISNLGERGAFDREKLIAEFRATGDLRNSTIYQTIPVVAAWEAVEKAASASGFEFRVPKHQARNPKNNPTPDESAILARLEKGDLPEYIQVDRAANLLTYARPIRLSQDCLSCHGDPAKSPTNDGKDSLGFPMENWRAGEVHGAFVLKTRLDRVDAVVRRGMLDSLAWLLPASALVVVGFILLNRRIIVRPLSHSIDGIHAASGQTSATADHIAGTGHTLADGASEQAAALEQTASSLEEIASMTKRNADHAAEAKQTASRARTSADTGHGRMVQMQDAMQSIAAASRDITAILKTIDEIAFQTNILALNAAVEAARAGEHGAGFAVVAEEVRALAQRSAAAARETAAKIEDCVLKSQRGVEISGEVAGSLEEIQREVIALDKLVTEIASASAEQNSGLAQVNTAVASMDKVTQTNAGNAQEISSASAQLNAQAGALNRAITELRALIQGGRPAPGRQATASTVETNEVGQ